jgi:H+/Cl- antiporter ClcA
LSAWYDFKFRIIAEGAAVGLIAGVIIVFYRFVLEYALALNRQIYGLFHKMPWLVPVWFVFLGFLGWFIGCMVGKEPMLSGSGIPQIKGVLHKKLKMKWWRVVIGKFFGGALTIGGGLSLGREGPSIQIGAAIGQGFSRLFKKSRIEEKYLITSGASAGLAAAFNAPLAGVIFALEELHKNFSPTVMISALIASISADFVSKEFLGLNPVFHFSGLEPIPLDHYFYLIGLGMVTGFLGIFFNKTLLKTQDLYRKIKIPARAKPIIAFITAGILGFIIDEVLGSGHEMVNSLIVDNPAIAFLLILLVVKFFFTMISYGSSAPGGIFLPLLVIGALIGNIYGDLMTLLFGFSQAYAPNFIILAMAAYFTAIVKAPITGIILITEMTGSFSNLLSVSFVCLLSYLVTEILNSRPVYDLLLERLLNKNSTEFESGKERKTIIEVPVHMGSQLDGRKIKDVQWPPHCLIVGLNRGNREIIPHGDTSMQAGDYLVVITDEDCSDQVRECLYSAAEHGN